MKPSDVYLSVPPLVDTFGKSEMEYAAGLVVRTCVVNGDVWQPISAAQIGAMLRADIEAKTEPFCSLSRNPYFNPNIWKLVELGFGRWVDKEGGSFEFTELGFQKLRGSRWVRKAEDVQPG